MKTYLKLLSILLLLQSFSCSKQADKTTLISTEMLIAKKQKIIAYINNFPCSATVGCNSIAFGAKPCGGPWEYLVYSNAVNLTELQSMVEDYNQTEATFNLQTGALSDCMAVSPPAKVGCVNGKCGVIN